METMRIVSSNVAGARVSRFPRRKRGINSRALVVRRRWYFAFKSELFTLFPTSRHSPPFTYNISGEKRRKKRKKKGERREEGRRETRVSERRHKHTHVIYLNKGRYPRRVKNPRFVFTPYRRKQFSVTESPPKQKNTYRNDPAKIILNGLIFMNVEQNFLSTRCNLTCCR